MFDIEVFTKNLLLLWETSANRLPLFLTVAMSIFLGGLIGAFLVRLLRPREKVLELQLADAQRQLTDSNNSLSCLAQESKTNSIEKLEAQEKNKKFDAVREALLGKEDELWKLHPASPPERYHERLAASLPRILLIANLKGGVGKTTITANLAAYFEKYLGKRVLLIDMDYQGSLSETMMRMVKRDYSGSLINEFVSGNKSGEDLLKIAKSLGPELSSTHLLPSTYDLYKLENQLMLEWLLQEPKGDVRFNLGQALLHPAVQNSFDVILIDGPPRISTGAINALSCCHNVIIPTVPDALSVPAVGRYLEHIEALKLVLNPALKFSGVILNQTSRKNVIDREQDAIAKLRTDFEKLRINGHIFSEHIPYIAPLASVAGHNVLYLRNKLFREGTMDKLGAEVAKSIGFGVVK